MPLRSDSHACAAQLRAGEIARRRAHSARARPPSPPRSEPTGRLGSLVRGMQSRFGSINGSLSISLQRTFGQLFSPLIRTTLPENPGITLPPHIQRPRRFADIHSISCPPWTLTPLMMASRAPLLCKQRRNRLARFRGESRESRAIPFATANVQTNHLALMPATCSSPCAIRIMADALSCCWKWPGSSQSGARRLTSCLFLTSLAAWKRQLRKSQAPRRWACRLWARHRKLQALAAARIEAAAESMVLSRRRRQTAAMKPHVLDVGTQEVYEVTARRLAIGQPQDRSVRS